MADLDQQWTNLCKELQMAHARTLEAFYRAFRDGQRVAGGLVAIRNAEIAQNEVLKRMDAFLRIAKRSG